MSLFKIFEIFSNQQSLSSNTGEKQPTPSQLIKEIKNAAKAIKKTLPNQVTDSALEDLKDANELFTKTFSEKEIEHIKNLPTELAKETETRGKLSPLSVISANFLTDSYTQNLSHFIEGLLYHAQTPEEKGTADALSTALTAIIEIACNNIPKKEHLLSLQTLKETLTEIKDSTDHNTLKTYAETLLNNWSKELDLLCDNTTENLLNHYKEEEFLANILSTPLPPTHRFH